MTPPFESRRGLPSAPQCTPESEAPTTTAFETAMGCFTPTARGGEWQWSCGSAERESGIIHLPESAVPASDQERRGGCLWLGPAKAEAVAHPRSTCEFSELGAHVGGLRCVDELQVEWSSSHHLRRPGCQE
eukprot:scaffold273690_cov32-Tisochrysis_lutea.AAC.3